MRTILIVDDEDDIREVAEMCFDIDGQWTVLTASSGRRALEIAEKTPPDVILMDVMMPDMDGPTTVGVLRQNPSTSDIPVILLTAKVQASDREQFSDLDIHGVIAKPFDPMNLAVEVAEKLGPE